MEVRKLHNKISLNDNSNYELGGFQEYVVFSLMLTEC